MRTTLALDDDIFLIARQQAARDRIPLGAAVSRLARQGLMASSAPMASTTPLRSRYSVLPARDELITNEHVRHLMDAEGI